MKAERIQQLKKAFTLYRRGGLWFCLQVEFIFKYTTFKVQKEKLPNIFEKYKERVRTMTKKERERQIKKGLYILQASS